MPEIIRMPLLSDTMEQGTILKWHKREGDTVQAGEVLVEIESDKAAMEFESPASGVLLRILVQEGETAPVQAPIAIIGKQEEAHEVDALVSRLLEEETKESGKPEGEGEDQKQETDVLSERQESPSVLVSGRAEDGRIKASPLARRLAREYGIPLEQIQGSGPGGRIIKRDIEAFLEQRKKLPAGVPAVPGPEYTDVPVRSMRATIARRLQQSMQEAPHYYLTIDVCADRLLQLHRKVRDLYPEEKVSLNDVLMKVVAEALKRHPEVNASWQDQVIRQYHVVHLGFAVAVEDGLVVPVIRYADRKGLLEISREARMLIEKARNRKLAPEEMQGSTFTISNLGMFGIDEFTAVINPPEAAILAVGRVRKVPVVAEDTGEIRVEARMRLTMSCDHRVIDGATGAKFLQTLRQFLEAPELTLV